MYDSYHQSDVSQRARLDWEEQFYNALSTSREPNEASAAAEWIVFSHLLASEGNPLSTDEREAMDDCLFVLRRFQVEQLNYPRLNLPADNANLSVDEERVIERAFQEIVGRLMFLRQQPYFLRKIRRA